MALHRENIINITDHNDGQMNGWEQVKHQQTLGILVWFTQMSEGMMSQLPEESEKKTIVCYLVLL